MLECTVKRTHKFWLAFFLVALVVQGVFLMAPAVSADTPSQGGDKSQWDFKPGPTENAANASPNNTSTSAPQADNKPPSSTDSCFSNLTKCLLVDPINAFTRGLGFVAGGAAILFVWMVQPENISGPGGIMNKESVYNLWAFVRDFFNVFFILILLFSAFATIFQVENFSIRKIFLNILLAALIINFSFPITRFLIDLTNVPMYYFLNAILPGTDGGQAFTETFLGSTGMSGLQVLSAPDLPRALIALVFTFLFMISLLVLAILFLVRFIALTLLLILSPIGFAASLLPGLQSAGSKWWEKFWQYALFGPSAAFMMLIAMRFQNEIATDGTVVSFNRVSTPMTAGSGDANILALVGFYVIPLILIWTAIGMANSSSIAGASFVTGLGYGAARKVGGWGKKMVVGGGKAILPTNVAKGLATGVKDGLKGGKLFGLKVMPKGLTPKELKKKGEEREAYWKGVGSGGFAGGNKEKAKLFDKRVAEEVKENRENEKSRSQLHEDLKSPEEYKKVAAAMSLSQTGIRSMEELNKVLGALSDSSGKVKAVYQDRAGDILAKIDGKMIGATPAMSGIQNLERIIQTLGSDNVKAIELLIDKLDSSAFQGSGAHAVSLGNTITGINPTLADVLKRKIIKEGEARVLVESLKASSPAMTDEAAVHHVLGEIKSVKDVIASASLFQDARYGDHARSYVNDASKTPPKRRQEIEKVAAQESSNPGIYF